MSTAETTTRLLADLRADRRPVSLTAHLRRHGALDVEARTIVDVVADSGLRGRGGAGFPTARKLAAVREHRRRAVVVANGVEGEPIARKDKVLLGYLPQLVLDGAVAAAHAVGASEVIVAAPDAVRHIVDRAVAERREQHLDGPIRISVVTAPDTFVAGEETALVQFLNGGPALPTFTPPRPFDRGVRGQPTLIQNVETLAHLALIARYGAAWFRAAGTEDEPGTTLVTLSGAFVRPGVYEIPLGYPFTSLVADAGGLRNDASAFLVGGYFGSWVSNAAAQDVALSEADLSRHGASLGARAIVALPEGACGVAETARIARYLAEQSAAQCGPCVHGLDAVAHDLERLVRRDGRIDPRRLEERLMVIRGRGACRHPDGAVRLVASGLRVFNRDVQQHLKGRRCR